MDQNKPKYYIGLDCGTSSVGWAVTDENYNLLTANGKIKKGPKTKTKTRTLWGVRLFDEAETAAERRTFRSARRRNRRAKDRLKLLRLLFRDEMIKVDREFYKRLHESFYYEEDKHLHSKSKNTLFNDTDFTDKDFHKTYPTIWHLRQAIIDPRNENRAFDLRLYFLAIQHILKHRGHFLYDGKFSHDSNDFDQTYADFCDVANEYGFNLEPTMADSVKEVITSDQTITDKKKAMKSLALFIEQDELEDKEEEKAQQQAEKALAELLVGASVNLATIFKLESDEKINYSLSQLDEKEEDIANAITVENMELLKVAKRIYDYGVLDKLLDSANSISEAMVANYDQHEKDLKEIKDIFRPHPQIYKPLFKTESFDEKFPNYNAYIGKAYTEDKQGRRATKGISQEDFNKHLKKLLEEIGYTGELLERAEKGTLLPKQRGQAKGTIPQQLHHEELEKILDKLAKDYPSFAQEVPGEDKAYNTKCKKIAAIHSFRIPYYCGPLVSKPKSQFSWADEEISELVRPWNFDELVNKEQRAENFISRMTNECTFLIGEKVLPKNSLRYQKYMVLNELNNLRVDGRPLDVKAKQEVYERVFRDGEIKGNVTLNKLGRWLKDVCLISPKDDVSGTSESKFLPQLKTYQDFRRILGGNFEQQYSLDQLEKAVEAITVLNNERAMLKRKTAKTLGLDEKDERVQKLSKLSYKDWGRMSARFLDGITIDDRTVLNWLWESQYNLQQLRGQEVGFDKKVEEFNLHNDSRPQDGAKLNYSDVQNLYCSPAVKRSVWQTIKIVDELIRVKKVAPAKIFIEVTRGEDKNAKGKYTLARKKDLEAKLKPLKSPEAQELLAELGKKEERDLQSKKLFLYFSQMGKCAYSGDPIDLEELNNTSLYDIDHIYPRSKTKDDSITRNLVLVKAELNREKTNIYPISESTRSKMAGTWRAWQKSGLITKEKYDRLVRATPLTNDELGGFIARQIVETSQTVKAIRDLLQRAYPETKVIMVKAGQVSDFRHKFANGVKYRNSQEYKVTPRPEFLKVRELNDYHHAKDAYLNIVVGNVMNMTFTSNPYEWIKQRNGKDYTITTDQIFRDSLEYEKANGEKTIYPETKGWNFANSINLVSNTLKRNDILWTRMSYIESGQLSDLQIVGKTKSIDGILPIKQSLRFSRVDQKDPNNSGVAKYGGYNSIKGAHFALIECKGKKGERQRRLVSIPQVYQKNIEKFIRKNYVDAKILLSPIKFKSKIIVNSIPLHITGRTGDRMSYQHALQLTLNSDNARVLKNAYKVHNKTKIPGNATYVINADLDGIDDDRISVLMDELMHKVELYGTIPSLETAFAKIKDNRNNFDKLDSLEKCKMIAELLKVFSCGAERANLSSFVPAASQVGIITTGSSIDSYEDFLLVNQSPTGLYEEIIDLKTVQPKIAKVPKGK